MRSRRVAAAAVTVLAATGVLPSVAASAQTTDLWVDRSSANCADDGPGGKAAPFCTVSAAARTAGPGQTVHIAPGAYPEDVVLTRSGTAGAPIVFTGPAVHGMPGTSRVNSLVLDGVHHVEVAELGVVAPAASGTRAVVDVTDSQQVGLSRLRVGTPYGDERDALHVGGGTDVSVTRSSFNAPVEIDGGSTGTTFGTNWVTPSLNRAIVVDGAPGTAVTSNTVVTYGCATKVRFGNGSTGGLIANNVLSGYDTQNRCPGQLRYGIDVSTDSVAGTSARYDSVETVEPAYRWAGTAYTSADAFRAGTGQGERDFTSPYIERVNDSAVDSADAGARGTSGTAFGDARVDHPNVANTGTGPGWYDRGAGEVTNPLTAGLQVTNEPPLPGPYGVAFDVAYSSPWFPVASATLDFGDGSAPVAVTDGQRVVHSFPGNGSYQVELRVVDTTGKPVVSTRPLTLPAGPISAGLEVRPVEGADLLTTRVEAVDPYSPYPVVSYRYDFGDGSTSSSATPTTTHRYAAPGTYTVRMNLADAGGRTLDTDRTATVTVGPAYVPLAQPVRTLDTRSGLGAPKGRLGPDGTLKLKVTGTAGVPGDGTVTAVLVNLTATGSTEETHVIAYGDGTRPDTSNLNAVPGRDVGNTAMVPVAADGTITLYNHSGRTDLVADVQGYYGVKPQVRTDLHPVRAVRALDTRSGLGARAGALGADASLSFKVRGPGLLPDDAKVAVLNLTATGSTEHTYIAANPSFPVSVSNLNVSRGATVANQVTVPIAADGTVRLYNHVGAVQVIADLQGYYGAADNPLVPVRPVRALDTRTAGKPVSPASETLVDVRKYGVPADATAVLVNLTGLNSRYEDWLAAGDPATTEWTTSNLNLVPGAIVSNLALVPVRDGLIEVANHVGSTDAIVDIQGYTAP
ncbi:PKD domain-containing protein [Kitasatospora fiedleri]|uniref:PKD domain-containing protein n=1 Tax=Kitasatospora fiedleri TaxID=2991545 RepID=UPI00249CCAC4|nr:PKD domain-containing protein [Kitasatospora fiedleri]